MTTAMLASSSPHSTAAISDWRLLPRPEMSTPRRRDPGDGDCGLLVAHTAAAVLDAADLARAGLAGAAEFRHQLRRVLRCTDENQSDPHVERAEHVGGWDVAFTLKPLEDGGRRPGSAIDD